MPGPNSQPHAMRNDGRTFSGKTELARVGLKSGEGLSWARKPARETKRTRKARARKTRLN